MRIVTFASGSSGNCALLTAGGRNFLIDAGISLRRIRTGLCGAGLSPADLDGVFVTHEHSDHVAGLPMLLKYYTLPVYAPGTVAARLGRLLLPEAEACLRVIHTAQPLTLGGRVAVTAFHTMHDTPESVGYRFDAESSFGFCTDLGCVTDEVRETLCGVDAALVEANHDEEMLRRGGYPPYLKRRILSDNGHLSNESGADLAAFLAEHGAGALILGHLSRENNTEEKARGAVLREFARRGVSPALYVAPPAAPLVLEVDAACSA